VIRDRDAERRRHARMARVLIKACGGLEECADLTRVGKSQLSDYQNPNVEAFMPADVMADLEEHCGRPLYSAALAEAVTAQAALRSLTDEACEASEAAADLQRKVRQAVEDGVLTAAEREDLSRAHAKAMDELRQVGEALVRR